MATSFKHFCSAEPINGYGKKILDMIFIWLLLRLQKTTEHSKQEKIVESAGGVHESHFQETGSWQQPCDEQVETFWRILKDDSDARASCLPAAEARQ